MYFPPVSKWFLNIIEELFHLQVDVPLHWILMNAKPLAEFILSVQTAIYDYRNEETLMEWKILSQLYFQTEKETMIEKTKVIQKRKYTRKDPYWIRKKKNSMKYLLSSDPKKEEKLYVL